MRASDFDTRVTFYEKVESPDGGGGSVVSWPEMGGDGNGARCAAVWAVPVNKGDEETSPSRSAGATDYRLIVRTDSETRLVKSDWRVMIDGRIFALKAVPRPDRNRGTITMIIQEGQAT